MKIGEMATVCEKCRCIWTARTVVCFNCGARARIDYSEEYRAAARQYAGETFTGQEKS